MIRSAKRTLRWSLQQIGLPPDFPLKTEDHFNTAFRCWKERTVDARRANQDRLAADLSLAKANIVKRQKRLASLRCPRCGKLKSPTAEQCRPCALYTRFYSDKVEAMNNPELYKVETPVEAIPDRSTRAGPLMIALRKLATGQIGDTFVTDKNGTMVASAARKLGGNVIVRCINTGEKDPKKRLYRVWRSDGLSMDEVNAVIRDRIAGMNVPDAPAWKVPDEKKKVKP